MAEWTRDQVLIALNLYCQLPFGRLHYRNPEIIEVAAKLGRTPGSLAMKLTNLASLDPVIVESGRKGLSGASALDRRVWQEFQENPEQVGYESQVLMDALVDGSKSLHDLASEADELDVPASYRAETTTATVTVRVKQSFFRRAVLSSYDSMCCMSGIKHPSLLVASHIVPWSKDEHNRLNPANGLCLSALHDKAFDRGLLTVMPDLKIRVSSALRETEDRPMAMTYLMGLDGETIRLPKKFAPDKEFLRYHNEKVFVGV